MADEARDWLQLPSDVIADILHRVGVVDILENAQKVCTTWRRLCKDPAMWRVIEMRFGVGSYSRAAFEKMCMHAVDRSEGQLVDISIIDFCSNEHLRYIGDRSSQLRRLEVVGSPYRIFLCWHEALEKVPLLEELGLYGVNFSKEDIEAAGSFCHMLKTLKINNGRYRMWHVDEDCEAIAIGENLPGLQHLELIGNTISNTGLQIILDRCCHLEWVDLRGCQNISFDDKLWGRCSKQIKKVRLPNDSLEDYPYMFYSPFQLSFDDEDDFPDFDDWTGYQTDPIYIF